MKEAVAPKRPVVREFEVEITQLNWRSRVQEKVVPEVIPDDMFYETSDLVNKLYPGKEIVHLEHPTVFGQHNEGKGTYSLFFKTLQMCFNKHFPFAFKPEALWYLIVHEVAQAVLLNPERYRLYFSNSDERQEIKLDVELGQGAKIENWGPHIIQLSKLLKEQIPSGIGDLFATQFSTSTPVSDSAMAITLMQSASPFYDYRMRLCCGLPLLRLDGQSGDYAVLVESAKALKTIFKKDLGLYFDHLIPVLEKIADQASGAPIDHEFWGSLYNLDSGSGGSNGSDGLGGWMASFINYLRVVKGNLNEEPQAVMQAKRLEYYDWKDNDKNRISIGQVPNHVSSVDFILDDYGKETPMRFIGGMLSAEVIDGFVTPGLSYGVLVD